MGRDLGLVAWESIIKARAEAWDWALHSPLWWAWTVAWVIGVPAVVIWSCVHG